MYFVKASLCMIRCSNPTAQEQTPKEIFWDVIAQPYGMTNGVLRFLSAESDSVVSFATNLCILPRLL